MNAETVLVTGASGFVGQAVVPFLKSAGYRVIVASRNPEMIKHLGFTALAIPQPDAPTAEFESLLSGVDHVVHAAAIAHSRLPISDDLYHQVNCVLTEKLAAAADRMITGKFIFMSSIRAQCGPVHDSVARETDEPRPTDAYGRSKLDAERAIASVMKNRPYTILRPVVVYGDAVKGNWKTLIKVARLPVPLPLRSLSGRRSLLYLDALCHAVHHCLTETSTDNQTFIVADKAPLTIGDIVTAVRQGLGRAPALFSVPERMVQHVMGAVGQASRWATLTGAMVASSQALQETGWQAADSMERVREQAPRL
ncbi:NAD-dependent epimerase/dehydratase family protein [Rhizobium sp. CFBP 8762]|uniref:NAD-dependent epimerase/dehydratase family protein n=1 Tax=Rhizobium sp. CFBP 8762 TaxID=2775279 RepID=UPI00177FDAE8|nr:NAD-dependent epimerase/dehydratase family protein [Rhizobium sp. CFBP 8762]MBD8554136.1 NAD-dependent epimerase/dehydratase family protein [Rhizobium sp. CFBP 8762]